MFKTMKKVWRYIAKYKKLLIITLTAMLIVQGLGLLAPLIVKSILDDYLVGIERPWYETTDVNHSVMYQDKYYTQEISSDQVLSVIIYEGKYYITLNDVPMGNKNLSGSILTVTTQEGDVFTYSVTQLSK